MNDGMTTHYEFHCIDNFERTVLTSVNQSKFNKPCVVIYRSESGPMYLSSERARLLAKKLTEFADDIDA